MLKRYQKGFAVLGVVVVVFVCVFHINRLFPASSLEHLVAIQQAIDHEGEEANQILHNHVLHDHQTVGTDKPTSSLNPTTEQATTPATTETIEMTNPGCTHKLLGYYHPKRAPTVYHHPPLVHYAKFSYGAGTLSYRDYMAMLSAYKFLKPKKIFIHSNVDFHGEYWDRTQKWAGTSVVVNKVPRVSQLGGKHVHWVQHEADYIKLKQMLEHGGVTSDFDVLVVNGTKLREQQRVSECVLSLEGDIVSNGFNSCIKNSSLIRRVLEEYHKNYKPHLWLYNCALYPTGVLQDKSKKCYNVYMDDTICIYPNVAQAPKWWLSRNGVDWRKKTAAHYFVKTGYPANERILKADHSLAEVFRYVNDS